MHFFLGMEYIVIIPASQSAGIFGIGCSGYGDRDQDWLSGIGYIRDIVTAGYIWDRLFANKLYTAVPISQIYPIPNTRSQISGPRDIFGIV